jgi:hypothetical protein
MENEMNFDWEKIIARASSDELAPEHLSLIQQAIGYYQKSIACLQKCIDNHEAATGSRSVKRSWNTPYGRST